MQRPRSVQDTNLLRAGYGKQPAVAATQALLIELFAAMLQDHSPACIELFAAMLPLIRLHCRDSRTIVHIRTAWITESDASRRPVFVSIRFVASMRHPPPRFWPRPPAGFAHWHRSQALANIRVIQILQDVFDISAIRHGCDRVASMVWTDTD